MEEKYHRLYVSCRSNGVTILLDDKQQVIRRYPNKKACISHVLQLTGLKKIRLNVSVLVLGKEFFLLNNRKYANFMENITW